MKKALFSAIFFHVLCYISMIAGHFMKNSRILGAGFYGDFIGVILCPMIIAVAAMAIALRDEKKVIGMYPNAAAAIGGIGLGRGLLFFCVMGPAGFAGAMKYLVLSFLILTLWFIIFEFSAGMLSKKTKFNRK